MFIYDASVLYLVVILSYIIKMGNFKMSNKNMNIFFKTAKETIYINTHIRVTFFVCYLLCLYS